MGARRDPTVVFLVVVAVVVAAIIGVAAVLGGDDEAADAPTTTTSVEVDEAVACPGADGRSRELRRCLEDALAFVETDLAAGSGVLLPSGHVVTNAHVVDPYDRVDLTFPGGEHHEDVHVLGVDAIADIAVLEPIETERAGMAIGPSPDLDAEDEPEVFLVGYPGGVEGSDPDITLASGILSRLRSVEAFDATYLQTDAAIAGGQSGGALVDGEGRVLGISGLGFAEEFALALSADDVLDAIDRILAGDGDERRVIPTLEEASATATTVDLLVPGSTAAAYLPAADDDRTVRLHLASDRPVAFQASTFFGEPLGANQAGVDQSRRAAEDLGFPPDELPLLTEVAPGEYDLEVPAGETAIVSLIFADEQPGTIEITLSEPFVAHADTPPAIELALGEPLDVVVDGFVYEQLFTIELAAGDEIEVAVRGASADPYYILLEPGEVYDPAQEPTADDGGGGLYDLDAVDTHRIDADGTYTIVVGTYDGVVTGYQVLVSEL